MKSTIVIFILLLQYQNILFAQKTVVVVGESKIRQERNMTEEQAEFEAILQARLNAIEKAFGTVIRGESHTWIKSTTGQKVITETNFDFIADNYLKGEWIGDVNEPEIKKILYNNETWYECKVKCKVRELKARKTEFIAYPLSCPEKTCKTENYNNDQNFYFYFKSAEKGFLSIFLAADGNYFRLLPYKTKVSEKLYNNFPVEADKEYIFFSKNNVYYDEIIDEIQMSTEYSSELNVIWAIFSPEEFSKPVLEDITEELLPDDDIERGFTMPKSLLAEDFLKWIQKIRARNEKIQVEIIGVKVIK